MFWIALYGVMAATVAVATFLAAEWFRDPGAPALDHPGVLATVTGLLWPVVVPGAAQCGLIVAIQSVVDHSHRPTFIGRVPRVRRGWSDPVPAPVRSALRVAAGHHVVVGHRVQVPRCPRSDRHPAI